MFLHLAAEGMGRNVEKRRTDTDRNAVGIAGLLALPCRPQQIGHDSDSRGGQCSADENWHEVAAALAASGPRRRMGRKQQGHAHANLEREAGVPGDRITREYASRWLTASRAATQALSRSHAQDAVPGSAVNLLLRLWWRRTLHFAMHGGGSCLLRKIADLGIGFALAGAIASAYQAFAKRPPSFSLLQQGPTPEAFAAVPLLVFTAPFIIMRNTLRNGAPEQHRIQFVMIATVLAG
eukprot:gene59233-81103_t